MLDGGASAGRRCPLRLEYGPTSSLTHSRACSSASAIGSPDRVGSAHDDAPGWAGAGFEDDLGRDERVAGDHGLSDVFEVDVDETRTLEGVAGDGGLAAGRAILSQLDAGPAAGIEGVISDQS